MNTVTVNASKTYDICIGSGLMSQLGQKAAALEGAKTVCIVSDTNVWPLYGAQAQASLESAGFSVFSYVFPAGEASKNGLVFLDLLNTLAQHHVTRSDLIVALGGGVVGDLAGFAAASFLRGIRFIQVPTTLLAAVDSSVGGKTAIDLPAGKNLAGAFCQPSLVLCDVDTLNTLPREIFRDGCAEVIKYGILYDPDLFSHLEEKGLDFDREKVITRCVELKRDVVMTDEFDTGLRMKLNHRHCHCHKSLRLSGRHPDPGDPGSLRSSHLHRLFCRRSLCLHPFRQKAFRKPGEPDPSQGHWRLPDRTNPGFPAAIFH